MKLIMIMILSASVIVLGCAKKKQTNKVDIDQIETDNSNNYRHIFKDQIEKVNEKDYYKKRKKDEFK